MSIRTALMFATVAAATVVAALVVSGRSATAHEIDPRLFVSSDASGQLRTFNVNGPIDPDNPFFQDLGTNGRRCVTCHQPDHGWSITPEHIRGVFADTRGTDPLFSNNDGSNCEGALPQSRAEKRAASSLLLTRGLIRVGLDMPANAEFAIDGVADPYRCGAATNDASFYRRPLPSTNVSFLSAVMWDGRESSAASSIRQDLMKQANDATRGHAQAGVDLTHAQAHRIVDFELGLFTAQARDREAGSLTSRQASGGPVALSAQPFFIGINDPVGLNPTGAAFDRDAFTLFSPWIMHAGDHRDPVADARRAIARGEAIFNTTPITLTGVGGLNGTSFGGNPPLPDSFVGTCSVCHDSPSVGHHSVKAPLDIGLTDPAVAPYLPVYTVRNVTTQETIETTDLGRAMISGKWADIGKFKGPVLRGLAAREPYFHNGSAATLDEVVDFYDRRFLIGFTRREKADLVAFLRAL